MGMIDESFGYSAAPQHALESGGTESNSLLPVCNFNYLAQYVDFAPRKGSESHAKAL